MNETSTETQSLQKRVEQLEARDRRRSRRSLAMLGFALVLGMMTSAVAQVSITDLIVFSANTPARAADVNANFALLKTWVERKVGDVDAACSDSTCGSTISGTLGVNGRTTLSDLEVTNRVTADFRFDATADLYFDNALGQRMNLWGTQYGIGIQSYTQYFRTDRNFAFYADGAHDDAELSPGTGGATLATISDSAVIAHVPLRQRGQIWTATSATGGSHGDFDFDMERYVVRAPPGVVGRVVRIDSTRMDALCRDIDGCRFVLGMYNWDGGGRMAIREGHLFVSETTNGWRLVVGGSADIEGVDDNSSLDQYNAWDCYFGDAENSTNTSNGRTDVNRGWGLLNARGGSYSDTNTECRVIIYD